MTRARAAWIGAGVLVLAAVGYLLRRRRRTTPAVAPAHLGVTSEPVEGIPSSERAVINEPPPIEEVATVHTPMGNVVEEREQPLATWARVAIVVVALLAFLAVSLIATKQV